MAETLSNLLRSLRASRGLTQRKLGEGAQLSSETVRSYELGRRTPDRGALTRLADAMHLVPAERRSLLAAAGEEAAASPRMEPLRHRRARVAGTEQELARYDWPSLVVNERHEIYGWNSIANAVAEADIGALLRTPPERNLLWMASLEHFEQRLVNWDELIGRLVTTFRSEGAALDEDARPQAYLGALIARLGAERPKVLDRFYKLWLSRRAWRLEMRNYHPVVWRLEDGTALRFLGVFRDWSIFDGSHVFDWMPADEPTSTWIDNAIRTNGRGGTAPRVTELKDKMFPQMLAEAREAIGLTRPSLADRAGVSPDAIYAYEHKHRVPRRTTVLAIARALTVDGLTTNHWLQALGYEEEPSDFARMFVGLATIGTKAGSLPMHGLSPDERIRDLNDVPWPCFMVNTKCEVEAVNLLAARFVPAGTLTGGPVDEPPHLLDFMMSPYYRERMRNWDEVARAVLPNSLRPYMLGYAGEKPETALSERVGRLRRRDPVALAALLDAWDAAPQGPSPLRTAVPVEWLDDNGALLRFHCFVSAWNGYDPYWAIDWHPANASAWTAMEVPAQGR